MHFSSVPLRTARAGVPAHRTSGICHNAASMHSNMCALHLMTISLLSTYLLQLYRSCSPPPIYQQLAPHIYCSTHLPQLFTTTNLPEACSSYFLQHPFTAAVHHHQFTSSLLLISTAALTVIYQHLICPPIYCSTHSPQLFTTTNLLAPIDQQLVSHIICSTHLQLFTTT